MGAERVEQKEMRDRLADGGELTADLVGDGAAE